MSSFNLVQIVPSLDSGGVERGTVDVANFLSKQKIHNHIISNGGTLQSHLNQDYTHHYTLPVNSKNFFSYPFTARSISKYIEDNNINLVHIRSRVPAWILSLISQNKFKTISTFHNVYGGNSYFKKLYNKRMAKVNHIVAISEYVKKEISFKYNIESERITVINRGIDTNFFNDNVNNNQKISFLKKYNIRDDLKIILYPGRITEWKGQLKFLSELKKLDFKKYLVLFVGDDSNTSHKNLLIKKIKDNNLETKCKLIGNLNSDELKIAYSISSIVLSLPNRPEGFGRTISETLSMEKIILAKNIGGAYDQLKHLDSIYKIDENDLDNLYNKIHQILNLSNDLRKKISNESRDFVINNFSLNKMVKSYLDLYDQISI